MINKVSIYTVLLLAVLLSSCQAPKQVVYFQDAKQIEQLTLPPQQPIALQPGDKICIVVNSADPMLENQFTLTAATQRSVLSGEYANNGRVDRVNSNTASMVAYTVDEQGDIDFPVLGKVPVSGKTRLEVSRYIRQRLIERRLVNDPIVTVEYVNLHINVLGEVKSPGRISLSNDHYTLLDALAQAGDLTINGNREQVMVLRNEDGDDHTYIINLCKKQEVMLSPAYYLKQNDVVYVAPTRKRMREQDATSNVLQQPTFWISLASLTTTVIALIIK